MAEDLGRIYWSVEADTSALDQAERRFDSSTRSMDRLGDRSDHNTRRMRRGFTDVSSAIKIASGALAAFGVANEVRNTIRTFGEFQKSMSQVKAITRASTEQFEDMNEVAKELGSTTEFTASQAASGFRFLGQAGFSASESVRALPSVLNLATAAAIELGQSADITSNIMSGFEIAADRSSVVTDVLAATSSRANTNVSQLGRAMSTVAPVAQTLGISVQETSAAIGAMSDAGIQGQRAGTALRGTLASLAEITPRAEQALSEMGLTVEDVNVEADGFSTVMDRLGEANISTSQAMRIFGREAASGALVLANNADRVREFTGELNRAEGEGQRMAETMRDNLTGDLQGLGSAVDSVRIALGERLEPTLRDNVQGVTDFARATTDFVESEGFSEWLDRAHGIGTALSILLAGRLAGSLASSAKAFAHNTQVSIAHGQALKENAALNLANARAEEQNAAATSASAAADLRAAQAAAARTPGFYMNASAMEALSAAEAQATNAANAHAAAQARATSASNAHTAATSRLAAAQRGLSSAFALIGGPAGAAVIAAGAVFSFREELGLATQSTEELRREIDLLDDSFSSLGEAQRELRVQDALEKYLDAAQRVREAELDLQVLQRQQAESNADVEQAILEKRGAIEEANQTLEQAGAKLSDLSRIMAGTTQETEGSTEATIDLDAATRDFTAALEDHRQAQDASNDQSENATELFQAQTNATDDLIDSLRDKLELERLSERQQATMRNLQQLGIDATIEQRIEVMRLSDALFRQEEANRDATTATSDLANTSRSASEQMQRDWQSTRETFGEFFADMVQDGESAFDSLLKSFERMLLEMTGQMAASGVMEMFGVDVPGGGAGGMQGVLDSSGMAGTAMETFAGSDLGQAIGSGSGISDIVGGLGGQELAGPTQPGQGALTSQFDASSVASGAGQLGLNLGAGVVGGFAGGEVGEAVTNKESNSNVGATAGGAIGSIWGPVGTLVGSAIGGLVDSVFGSGTPSGNAGILVGPGGGREDRDFEMDPFASGLQARGLNRRADKETVDAIVSAFRERDATIVEAIEEAGGRVNADDATLAGFSETGQGSGVFLGQASEGGEVTSKPLEEQLDFFGRQLINHVEGLDEELTESLKNAETTEQALRILNDAMREQKQESEDLSQAVEQATQSHQSMVSELQSATDVAFDQLKSAVDAEKDELEETHQDNLDRIRERRQAELEENRARTEMARERLSAVRDELSGLSTAAEGLRDTSDAITRARRETALETLSEALRTGDLTGTGVAAERASAIDSGQFSSAEELRREQARTLSLVGSVEQRAENQEDAAERTVSLLERQRELLKEQFDTELADERSRHNRLVQKLEQQLSTAREQLDALRGINDGVLGLASAIQGLKGAMSAERTATTGGTSNEDLSNDQIRSHVEGIVGGPASDATIPQIQQIYADAVENNVGSKQLGEALGFTQQEILDAASAADLPTFADGGRHGGGLRLVGERGPEIESTGPSQITSNEDLRSALSANETMMKEIVRMNEYMKSLNKSNVRMRDIMERWRRGGVPTTEADMIV